MKSAVIFDLDGTLLDTLTDLFNAVNHALTIHNMPLRTRAEIRSYLGNGVRNLMQRSVPARCPNDDFEATFADFRQYYALHNADFTLPYPGISELLPLVCSEGFATAIVSNKVQDAVSELNERFFHLDVAIGDTGHMPLKPAPDTVLQAMELLGVSREEAVYVGDSEVDLATARNAGLPCISVSWGFRDADELIREGARTVVSRTRELHEAITRFSRREGEFAL